MEKRMYFHVVTGLRAGSVVYNEVIGIFPPVADLAAYFSGSSSRTFPHFSENFGSFPFDHGSVVGSFPFDYSSEVGSFEHH